MQSGPKRVFTDEMVKFYLVLVADGWDKITAARSTVEKFGVDGKPESLINRVYMSEHNPAVKSAMNAYSPAMISYFKRLRRARIMPAMAGRKVKEMFELEGDEKTIADDIMRRIEASKEAAAANRG